VNAENTQWLQSQLSIPDSSGLCSSLDLSYCPTSQNRQWCAQIVDGTSGEPTLIAYGDSPDVAIQNLRSPK
jgi:hypothetical protein